MALARVKTWTSEVLTANDLNAEFNNILNNALSLISPLTGDLAAGGNKITGLSLGTVASPSLQFAGAPTTGIYSSGAGNLNFAVTGGERFTINDADPVSFAFRGVGGGVSGPVIRLIHDSPTPASGDNGGILEFQNKDSGGTSRIICQIHVNHSDITATSQDSEIVFKVQNNVNAGDAATTATLSSLGVWTDASAAAIKDYIGDMQGSMLAKAKALKTLGVYRGKDTPANKQATAELHYSPTAEEFYQVFGLGVHPSKTEHPGIAPKDVAWLTVKMALELDARLSALEAT